MLNDRLERWLASALIGLSVALSMCYAFSPLFERRDEKIHFEVVTLIAVTGNLPDRASTFEAHQPPLYYLGAVPFTQVFVDWKQKPLDLLPLNNFQVIGRPRIVWVDTINENFAYHLHTSTESIPSANPMVQAVRAVRIYSVLQGLWTLLVSYALLRRLWPLHPSRRLLALGLLASWQSFQYSFGSFTNDNAIISLSVVSLYLMVVQIQDGPSWRQSGWLGIVMGAALLAKLSGVVLMLPFAFLIVHNGRKAWRYGVVSVLIMIALAGWWFVRNVIIYGDLTGAGMQYAKLPMLRVPLSDYLSRLSPATIWEAYQTFWYFLGYDQIRLPFIFEVPYLLIVLGGVVGAIVWFSRRFSSEYLSIRPELALLGLFSLAMLSGFMFHAMTNQVGNSGRHLLQWGVACTALLAGGIDVWLPKRARLPVSIGIPAGLMALSAFILFGAYLPAFRPLPPPATIEHPLSITYEDSIRLIGVKEPVISASPGDVVKVELYWQAEKPINRDIMLSISTAPKPVVSLLSWPGAGTLLSRDWHSGQQWTDQYTLSIPVNTPPGEYLLLVRLLDYDNNGQLLITTDATGAVVIPNIGRLIVSAP